MTMMGEFLESNDVVHELLFAVLELHTLFITDYKLVYMTTVLKNTTKNQC